MTRLLEFFYNIFLTIIYHLYWKWIRQEVSTEEVRLHIDFDKGSDLFGDGTEKHPFATLRRSTWALPEMVQHQMTLCVHPGTYKAPLNLRSIFSTEHGVLNIEGCLSDQELVSKIEKELENKTEVFVYLPMKNFVHLVLDLERRGLMVDSGAPDDIDLQARTRKCRVYRAGCSTSEKKEDRPPYCSDDNS